MDGVENSSFENRITLVIITVLSDQLLKSISENVFP